MTQDERVRLLDDDDEDEEERPEREAASAPGFLLRRLLEARTILVAKPVDKDLMREVCAQLLVLSDHDPERPITVYVNSPGGDADSGFAIYDMMRFVQAPVRTVCAGLAASAAVIIYLGGEKGQRYSLPHSRFLIHQPSTYARGQASDLEITANEIIKIRSKYNQIVSEETGVPVDKIERDANRDFWLAAEEAKEYGLVDRIVASQRELA